MLNSPVNGKIQGLFQVFLCFQVLFKANLIFKDFSRQSCIFMYFSSLCKPCFADDLDPDQAQHFVGTDPCHYGLQKQFAKDTLSIAGKESMPPGCLKPEISKLVLGPRV